MTVFIEDRKDDFDVDWMEVLVESLCGVVTGSAVPNMLALVLGRMADAGLDREHEGILPQAML